MSTLGLPPPPPEDEGMPPPPPDDMPPPPPGGDLSPPPFKGPRSQPPPSYDLDGDEPSAINEYVAHILEMWTISPFHERDLTTTSPDQVVTQVENTFYSPSSLKRAMAYRPMPGDVVVSSTPRCGQTAVLTILDNLLLNPHGLEHDKMSDRIPWIESMAYDSTASVAPINGRRVFKTSISLSSLKMNLKPNVSFITVLRHPADLRLSMYRHLRKIHIQTTAHMTDREVKKQHFDSFYQKDDFAKVIICPFQTSHASGAGSAHKGGVNKVAEALFHNADAHVYEHEIVEWLDYQRANPRQVLVLFYEDLVCNPGKVIQRIAQFVNASKFQLQRVVDNLKTWEFPDAVVTDYQAQQAKKQSMLIAQKVAVGVGEQEKTQAAYNANVVKAPPRPPAKPRTEIRLPPGWKSAKDRHGEVYYYNKVLDLCQWNIPTVDQGTVEKGDDTLLNLSCLTRGRMLLEDSSLRYLDQVWEHCIKQKLNSMPDCYETLYLQTTGEIYPFGDREDLKRKAIAETETKGDKGGKRKNKDKD